MRVDDYAAMDAVALAAAVRSGELAPLEIVEAAIAAIERLNPALNAVVLADFDHARESARRVPRDRSLSGVPFLIKDVDVYAAEWPTTFSSRYFATARPRADSEIVRRWRAAGTVFLGKTNTPEFADDFATEPAFRGPTLNPWNPRLTVGGSSGGAAAAVASGMVPVAHGSDIGGSIRVPAACCGLFGFKPSSGLNPAGPYFGGRGAGLNCQHVLSRTVRDSAAFLDATAGPEAGGIGRIQHFVESYVAALERRPGPLRIACLTERADGTRVSAEVEAAVGEARSLLLGLGHSVSTVQWPVDVSRAMAGDSWTLLWMMEVALAIDERAAELGRGPEAGELEPLAHWIYAHVCSRSARDYVEAQRAAHMAATAMAYAFETFDILLMPTTATLPPPIGAFGAACSAFSYEAWCSAAYGFAPFTELFNVTGQPAASVPLVQSAGGLPIGIQIVAPPMRDDILLQVAASLEAATGWTSRHPDLWAGDTDALRA